MDANNQEFFFHVYNLLGLQVALGELQKAAGPDQRVTARADRLDAPDVNRKYYTGVWDSRDGTFIKWLSSAADASGIQDPDGLTEEADVNAASIAPERVVLHSASNSFSSAGVDVEADKVVINAFGSYAYWIEDEGVKAKGRCCVRIVWRLCPWCRVRKKRLQAGRGLRSVRSIWRPRCAGRGGRGRRRPRVGSPASR